MRVATEFLEGEEASGILLMTAAAVAMVWANLAPDAYRRVWDAQITIGVAPLALSKPVLLWINDGLMAVFFFVVGLEMKREIVSGELASTRRATLPVAAALGGMLAPAAIYAIFNAGGPGARGWGIPMATDIAFALGVLALLGDRVAPSLRVFLTAVAIADDLGAVAVIAVFYTETLGWMPLGLAVAVLIVLTLVNRAGLRSGALYVALGTMLWLAVLKSGIHATVAGVLVAFMIPAGSSRLDGRHQPLLERFEHALEPWVAFAILPLFALANAGVVLAGVSGALLEPVTVGIGVGLFMGKQLGVTASCWLVVRLRLATMPSGTTWRQFYGVALLCGIGFTMSLFIATLALPSSDQLTAAKIGILAGSILSAVTGYLVLVGGARRSAKAASNRR